MRFCEKVRLTAKVWFAGEVRFAAEAHDGVLEKERYAQNHRRAARLAAWRGIFACCKLNYVVKTTEFEIGKQKQPLMAVISA